MTYGLGTRASIKDRVTEQVPRADSRRSTAKAWRALDEARRIELVERALLPANDCIDGFPLAL
jgi:hypothetical protein